jgi:hypothetical protein
VRRVLASRPEERLPGGFEAAVARRIRQQAASPDGWLDAIDWRRWTALWLPIAAALILVAVLWQGPSAAVSRPAGQGETLESWALNGEGDAATPVALLRPDLSKEDVLASMLNASAASTGASDGR